jgi:hypothetical protein
MAENPAPRMDQETEKTRLECENAGGNRRRLTVFLLRPLLLGYHAPRCRRFFRLGIATPQRMQLARLVLGSIAAGAATPRRCFSSVPSDHLNPTVSQATDYTHASRTVLPSPPPTPATRYKPQHPPSTRAGV